MIHSAPANFAKRHDIRTYWAQDILRAYSGSVRYTFFTGKSLSSSLPQPEDQAKLEREMESFDDFLVVDLVDSYANLTLKSLAMLMVIKELGIRSKFILKVNNMKRFQDDACNNAMLSCFMKEKREA